MDLGLTGAVLYSIGVLACLDGHWVLGIIMIIVGIYICEVSNG